MNKRFFLLTFLCCFFLNTNTTFMKVFATNIDHEIILLNQKQEKVVSNIKNLEEEILLINKKAKLLLNDQNKLMNEKEKLKIEIQDLKERIKKRRNTIHKQACNIQINTFDNTLITTIIESKSIAEAFTRMKAVNDIIYANNVLLNKQIEDKESIEKKKNEIEKKTDILRKNQLELENKKGTLQQKKIDLAVVKSDLKLKKCKKENEKKNIIEEKLAALKEQKRIFEENKKISHKKIDQKNIVHLHNQEYSSLAVDKSMIINEAYKHLGKKYIWGAKGPDSFDCSGLTQYVYLKIFGRNIGGYTGHQENSGMPISISEAKPGDLLFWGDKGCTYHVAILVSDNLYIHAANPEQGVRTDYISTWRPNFAVRI